MTKRPQPVREPDADAAAVVGEVVRDCLLTRTRRISRVITSLYDQAMRPFGINSPQFSLLVLVARHDGASRAEIGRANFQERSTLTRNLALLLSEGLVEERPTQGNGRSRPIVISQSGRELLAAAAPAWRSAQAKAKQLLGDEGAAALAGLADSLPPDDPAA
jgi:DNA-binding MarR family transcriptional regulator